MGGDHGGDFYFAVAIEIGGADDVEPAVGAADGLGFGDPFQAGPGAFEQCQGRALGQIGLDHQNFMIAVAVHIDKPR